MKAPTVDEARDQLRRAREAFRVVGGKMPDESMVSAPGDPGVGCSALLSGAAIMMWMAAESALQGGDYGFYVAASGYYSGLADAQGC